MTYVFRADTICRDTLRVTTAAGVAVAKALDCGAEIKWVNDLYLNGKKICGILTETVTANRTYILLGIGINLTTADFPEDIRKKAGCIGAEFDKERLIASICDHLSQIADDVSSVDYLDYYRNHMYAVGELIVVEDRKRKVLCSCEISVRRNNMGGGDVYE